MTWYHYTLYDELHRLDGVVATCVYLSFVIFNVSVAATAGPVAVTVGLRMTSGHHVPVEKQQRYLGIALAVAALRAGILTVLQLVNMFVHLGSWIRQGLSVFSWNEQKIRQMPRVYVFREGRMWSSHIVDLLYALCTQSAFALVLIAFILGAYSGLGAGLAALTHKLLDGQVPDWILCCGLAVGFLIIVEPPPSFGPLDFWSLAYFSAWFAAQYAFAGVILERVARIQNHGLCTYRVAAGAGAAFGATLVAGRFPQILISFMTGCCGSRGESSLMPRPLRNNLAEKLLPSPASARAKTYWDREEGREILQRKQEAAEKQAEDENGEELQKHPDMIKVYWSRPTGLDKDTHYVLIVGDHKYELRDLSGARRKENIRYHTAPFNLAEAHSRRPYDVYLIGWTDRTHEQIDAVCRRIDEGWKYSRLKSPFVTQRGNCQHFLRKVADEITGDETHRARVWDWFRHDRILVEHQWTLASLRLDLAQEMEDAHDHVYGLGRSGGMSGSYPMH